MAHALEKQGKTAEAGNLYAQLKATYPWSPKVIEANFGIAQSLFQQKKYDDALKLLVAMVGARTAAAHLHAAAFLLLGQIYEEKGKIADAIDSYLKIATFYAGCAGGRRAGPLERRRSCSNNRRRVDRREQAEEVRADRQGQRRLPGPDQQVPGQPVQRRKRQQRLTALGQ